MILRAKTKNLFSGKELTLTQKNNSEKNIAELEAGKIVLESYPRRLVFELTNACNLNCVMCGRNAADFKPTVFDMDVFRSFEPLMDVVEEVTLMGWGEPTIHPNFIEMLEIVNRHDARKYFCTNGYTITIGTVATMVTAMRIAIGVTACVVSVVECVSTCILACEMIS